MYDLCFSRKERNTFTVMKQRFMLKVKTSKLKNPRQNNLFRAKLKKVVKYYTKKYKVKSLAMIVSTVNADIIEDKVSIIFEYEL